MLKPVRMVYTTPDLPVPALVEMWVPETEDPWAFRNRALVIAEVTVQATLQRHAARVDPEDN